MSLPTPRHSTRGTEGYSFAELFLALGPAEIGDPRENRLEDLIGRVYALVVTTSGVLELYQRAEDAATWTKVTEGLPPIFGQTQPETRRRFSIAFDQSARVIVAYEEDSTIYLTRWDADLPTPAYVQNVTVPGVDPVVAFDATWAYDVTSSDVLLFFLSADRERVVCRVQRDLYATEYELHDFGTPVVLDRVTRLPIRYQLLASDAAGEPLTDGGSDVGLLSALYPYPAKAAATGVVYPPVSGEYVLVVITEEAEGEIVGSSEVPATAGGVWDLPIIRYEWDEGLIVTGSSEVPATAGGTYEPAIIFAAHDEGLIVTASAEIPATMSGLMQDVVLNHENATPDEITGAGEIPATAGGTYELA